MKRFFVCCLVMALLMTTGCGNVNNIQIFSTVDTAMGTVISQTIYTEGQYNTGLEVLQTIRDLENDLLSRRIESSEVYRVNHGPQGEEVVLSEELAVILEQSLALWEKSEGAFDVTLGPLIEVWDIDSRAAGENVEEFTVPTAETLREAKERCGSEHITLTREENEVTLSLQDNVTIDLGAVGKGVALDAVHDLLLRRTDVTAAVISAGGSILTYGRKPDGSAWKVGIVDPEDTSSTKGILTIKGTMCVSTSGDYERFVEIDGKRYHHILDPKTGYPAEGDVRSVTILSENGFESDALSTACFVLGVEKGLNLLSEYDAEGLFILRDGSVKMTEGMKKYYEP